MGYCLWELPEVIEAKRRLLQHDGKLSKIYQSIILVSITHNYLHACLPPRPGFVRYRDESFIKIYSAAL